MWSVFLVLLLLVYILFANLNRYLDFVLPLGLCFAHLGYERLKPFEGVGTWVAKLRKKHGKGNAPTPRTVTPEVEVKQQESQSTPPPAAS